MIPVSAEDTGGVGGNLESEKNILMADALAGNFIVNSSFAEGLKITLYNAESGTPIKSMNWLKQPVDSGGLGCVWFHDLPKTSAKNSYIAVGTTHVNNYQYILDPSIPNLGVGEPAKEWALNPDNLSLVASRFGIPYEDMAKPAYKIAFEPIGQLRCGQSSATIIGTATEVSRYICDMMPGYVNSCQTQEGKPQLTTAQCIQYVSSQIGNYTNLLLPNHYYMTAPDLGLSPGSGGWHDSYSIIGQGQGIGIIYFNDKMQASWTPWGNSAYCPHTGPWTGLTIDPNDPVDPSKVLLQDPEKIPTIDSSLPPHGDPAVLGKPCICTPKSNGTTGNIIPKDFVNEKFRSESASADPYDTYDSDNSSSVGGNLTNAFNDKVVRTGSFDGYHTFLGDRGAVANPTNLVVSKAHNAFGEELIPSLKYIKNLGYDYEGTHAKDKSGGTASVSLPSVTAEGHYEEWVSDDDEDGGGHWETVYTTDTASWSKFDYTAENTVFEDDRAKTGITSIDYSYSKGNRTVVRFLNGPSQTIDMTPSYKMKYFKDSSSLSDDVWMLASGIRSYTFAPYTQITALQPEIHCLSPWSRDKIDVEQTLNVTKAGNAIKVWSDPIDYEVKLTYYLKDEFFEDGQKHSYSVNSDYVNSVQYIAEQLTNLHFASNIPFTGDHNGLIINNLGIVNKLSADILRKSLVDDISESSFLEYSSPKIDVTRSNFNSTGIDSNTKSTFDGKLMTKLGALDEIKSMIVQGEGVGGWYDEDYEGLIKIVITQYVRVTPPDNRWIEIYRGVSDWLSAYNDRANPCYVGSFNFYSGKNFVFGLGGYVDQKQYSGFKVPNLPVWNNVYEFKIRGSAFDQH